MFKVFPKVDDLLLGLAKVKEYITTGVEVQMTCTDLQLLNTGIRDLIVVNHEIKEITIHSPMSHCDIEKNFNSGDRSKFMISLVANAINISKEYDIRINVLFHCSNSFAYFQGKNQLWMFRRIIKMMKGTKTYLLLENDISMTKTISGKEPVISVIKMMRSHKLLMCLDLCHVVGTINNLQDGTTIESMYFDSRLNKIVRQVHFSATWDEDGIKDMSTHSRYHKSKEEMIVDIKILKRLGLGDCNLVTEVIENNYSSRIEQLKELNMLREII